MLPKHAKQRRVLVINEDTTTTTTTTATTTVQVVVHSNLKTSLYDWDSPSSFTGTVKRRPHSIATTTTNCSSSSSSCSSLSSPGSPSLSGNNNLPKDYYRKSFHSGQQQIRPRASIIIGIGGSDSKSNQRRQVPLSLPTVVAATAKRKKMSSMRKDKPTKLRIPKVSDRNANATGNINSPGCGGGVGIVVGVSGGATLKKQHHESSRTKLLQLKSPSGNKVPSASTARNQSSKKSTSTTPTTTRNAPSLPPLPPPPATIELPPFMGPGSAGGGGYRFVQNPYDPVEFTELFCDFPVCYESTTIIAANNFAGVKPLPPPYREPPPPTPPPISQMPSLLHGKRQQQDEIMATQTQTTTANNSNSNTSSPSRGKVVLSKKERKELTKNNNKSAKRTRDDPAEADSCEATALQKHNYQDMNRISSASNYPTAAGAADEEDDRIHINAAVAMAIAAGTEAIVVSETSSPCKQKSPYKGRVTELKNCIAKINSRGLFSSLSSSSKKESSCSSNSSSINGSVTNLSNNTITSSPIRTTTTTTTIDPIIAPEVSDSTSPFKNIPVRQRKGGIPPMENYCLFDPSVDFINEKTLKRRKKSINDVVVDVASPNLIDGDEFIEEIIYHDDDDEDENDKNSFDHHNYFVIDPEDFEIDPTRIGIPNPFSNEELISQKLILASKSISLEKCNDDSHQDVISTKEDPSSCTPLNQSTTSSSKTDDDSSANSGCQTNINDMNDNNNNNNDSTNDSSNNDMMIGSSTSTHTAASSSSTTSSSSSSSTTKKLSFLNLSPFRSSSLRSNHSDGGGGAASIGASCGSNSVGVGVGSATAGRGSSDDVQFCHRTIPIESNYVLFNPGPVPSRNVQYKIRKPRPLSTHSDADSGFLSPCSPDELKFNPAILVLQQCDSVQGYIEIYTDWANYYLDRAKSKKKVTDLSADCRDGLLLADVIEAVTSFKVPDLCKKPKNQQQMYDNVNSCLNVLRTQAVSGLESITTNDICAGRLKAVLALFFALSRFKQQSKQSKSLTGSIKAEIHHQPQLPPQQQTQQQLPVTTVPNQNQNQSTTTATINNANVIPAQQTTQNGNDAMINRQIPNAYGKGNGGTAIPLPATVLVQRRCPPDKVRPLPPTPNHTPTIPGLAKTGVDINGSSRPGSPPTSNHTIQTIKGAGNNNGLRQPQCKIPTSPHGPPPNLPNGSIPQHITANGPAATTGTTTTATKHSMLDKLKLFNKDKTPSSNSSSNKSQVSKRTSSSSGFSSARSERSDSSLSLNDGHLSQIKPPAVSVTANRSKDKSKQSKLLSGGSQKSSITSSSKLKLDKKEKSPARSSNDADSKLGHSSIGRGQKSLTRGDQKVSSKSSSKTSLNSKLNDSRSESKTSLIMPPNKTLLPAPGISTSIPKPVAAIKGTSKTIPPPPVQADNKKPAALPVTNAGAPHDKGLKREKSDISSNRTPTISDNSPQKTHIVKPIALLPDQMMPGSPLGRNLTYHQQQQVQQHLQQNNNNISVNGIQQLCGGGSPHQLQDPHNMTYRTGSETYMMTSPAALNGRIMQSSKTNSLGGGVSRKMDFRSPEHNHSSKFNTVPSKIVGTIYEEEKPVSVMPMRPLLRGYNTHHVTLPTRGARGHHFIADFCESDIGQGYCSDGDALRTRVGGPPSRFADIDNGYLSEGGGGIHGGKHFLTMMRARTQLPTTIEERIRNSRGSLDSIGTTAPSSNSSNGSKMDSNGSPNRSSSRNGRDNWSKMPDPPVNGHNNVGIPQQHHHHQQQQQLSQPPSPTSGRKDKSSPRRTTSASKQQQHQQHQQQQHHGQSSSSSSSGSSRTKGVPPSFGYVKRSNGSATSTAEQQNIMMMGGGGSGQNSCGQQQQQQQQAGRTAHVSAVPRSGKIKVSGGTQTCNNDMQTKISPNAQHRSFSLTGPGATQLSQSIRERLATGSHSLPKPGTDMHVFQHRISNRTSGKMIDGSLSDTQTYAEVKPEYSTYAMWLKHSNTAGSRLSEGDSLESLQIGSPNMNRHNHKIIHRGGGESPYIQSPRLNRSNSIRSTKSEKMYPSMLSRGPDVEIEPYYCLPVGTVPPGANNGHVTGVVGGVVGVPGVGGNVNQVVGVGPAAWSQPTSPTPINRGFGGPLSPTHGGPANLPGCHRLTYPKKNDDVHGSAASLLSGGSSLYGSAEERQANEIRRLKRELTDARDQVMSLSSQLSTNAHVVAAFEQSLSNMTQRLHQLTATAERKDGELTDMRQTIELLRKQSIQAGLTTAHMQSMGVQTATNQMCPNGGAGGSGDALFANSKPPGALANLHPRPQSATNGSNSGIPGSMQRHHSSDSMCSLNSISSGCSVHDKKNKKKGWLRSSFTKAFSRNAKISKTNRHIGHSSADQQSTGSNQSHHHHHHHGHHQQHSSINGPVSHDPALAKVPSSPTKNSPQKTVTLIDNAKPIDAIDHEDHQVVEDLKKQLREKDLVLTDIRLEALSSASQLENLKDTVMKMRAEMINLKQNNERLQKLVTSRSLAGSEASLGNAISPSGSIGESRRYSLADGNSRPPMELPKRLEEEVEEENIPPAPAPEPPPPPLSPTTHIDLTPPPPAIEPIPSPAHLPTGVEDVPDITDGKKLAISCYLGQPESFPKYYEEILETDDFYRKGENGECSENGFDERKSFPSATLNEFVIAYTYISGKTTWQNLDYIVRKTFKDYVSRIDPGTNLGLNTDSITSYHLGDAKRGPEMGFPELLPCGYIVGNVRSLYICLQGVGSLAFDSLIPRSIVHRYISLLTEHRRLILCGPSGTGKSYLARRLAEFLVARSARGNPSEAIATFNVDHKSSKELRQYLGHIAEQASIANGAADLPSVIILDNLHHASALGDVFSCLLSAGPAAKLPCIIGTMSQATCNTTNLQLHHNFRWVLTANHMEPVKGFLGRFLRRRLFQLELQTLNHQPELASVLAWLPTVWQHINRFLEIHSSSDVTIGPRLFLSCPLDLKDSQVWFTDIWNYHLSPYLVEAVREGVQLYGRRGGAWNDPSAFIRNSYPWPYGPDSVPPLRQINAEDVGLEGMPVTNGDAQDPLLNMLMRLQEAANYSENQEQESDCASLDSNITPDSSAGAE